MKPTQAEINELKETLKSNIDKIPKAKLQSEVLFLVSICILMIQDLSEAMQQIIESEENLK